MRVAEEHEFSGFDGQPLFYRHWPAQGKKAARVLVLLHRGHEHSGRLQHIVDELNLPDTAMFAWDARGHGRNVGPRGFSPSVSASVRDLDCFVQHLCREHGITPSQIVVVAQSVGAVLASIWVHDYAPAIRGLVLAAPAFSIKLYVPFAYSGLRLQQKLRGNFFVNSYVKARFLTHDPERIASYEADPLITRPISVNMLLGLHDTAERIVEDAAAIVVPTQVLISGSDFVVHQAPQQRFYKQLGSAVKELHVLPGFYHDTLGERDRHLALQPMRAFILRLDRAPAPVDLTRSDRHGYSFERFKQLQQPRSLLSPTRWSMALTRLTLATVGRLSKGIRLGWKTGFDSGSTLDYVYRNQPQGHALIGWWGDRSYLNSVGWKGIRQRKIHLQELIDAAIGRLHQNGQAVKVVDIAAGHGRYVLDAIEPHREKIEHVLLRDYSPINVAAGRALIGERKLGNKVHFVEGNAFDRESLAGLPVKPSLAVVSGLYELFPDNGLISTSLAGLADSMAPGSYLVFTNQPWHPQLELIARTLKSHRDGEPWIMRCRTQAEMQQLLLKAGFEVLEQRIDEWGIFSVGLARRVEPKAKTVIKRNTTIERIA